MVKQVCPTCGCYIGEKGYEKEGVFYCCQPCASGSACVCGCCEPVEKGEEGKT